MTKFIVGFVLGLVVASVGFTGLARMADHGVDTIKSNAQELSK
jgi:hypothetical protein